MAAGLGFKTFATGDVLTAGDTNGYLMQGVLVFASAAARDAAITSPQEGQFAYLKDTNVTMYYTGSAWANLDTTGMTNPMTTTGDTIYSSSGSTPARLGIGTTGQVLTVAGGVPSWATASAATNLACAYNYVATRESTTSTSYTNLTTSGPAVTVTTGTTALVSIKCALDDGADAIFGRMGFAVSGATTVAASDEYSIGAKMQQIFSSAAEGYMIYGAVFVVTGLTAGSNTFTAKYRKVSGPAGNPLFSERMISVVNLGN